MYQAVIRNRVISFLVVGVFSLVCLSPGCGQIQEQRNNEKSKDLTAIQQVVLNSRSGCAFLSLDDAGRFEPGRSKTDVLQDVNWRGRFELECMYDDKEYCSIAYQMFSDDPWGEGAANVKAIFFDKKFLMFLRSNRGTVVTNGTEEHQKEWKPSNIFDVNTTAIAAEIKSDPVDLESLQKEVAARPKTPSEIDPGLTTAYVLLGGLSLKATVQDYQRNAELRDQFNGAKLDVGMTQSVVEGRFNSKPLESGPVEAGEYAIFGSEELFNIPPSIHFSNVLVLYRDGRVSVIRDAGGGESQWRANLQRRFPELPVH